MGVAASRSGPERAAREGRAITLKFRTPCSVQTAVLTRASYRACAIFRVRPITVFWDEDQPFGVADTILLRPSSLPGHIWHGTAPASATLQTCAGRPGAMARARFPAAPPDPNIRCGGTSALSR